jgi:hypothetical protein
MVLDMVYLGYDSLSLMPNFDVLGVYDQIYQLLTVLVEWVV